MRIHITARTEVNFARLKHNLLLGLATAEKVKISIGSAAPMTKEKQMVVRGRDLGTGLPRSLKLKSGEVREALSLVIQEIIASVKETLEETPPELLADIMSKGIHLCGGGSLLRGLDELIQGFSAEEGLVGKVVTTTINSISNMDIHIKTYSEAVV